MKKQALLLPFIPIILCACMVAPSVAPVGDQGEIHPAADLDTRQAVEKYLSGRDLDLVEGAWIHEENAFELVIARNDFDIETEFDYVGIITRADDASWKRGEVKLLMRKTASASKFTGVWLTQTKARQEMNFAFKSKNLIQASFVASDGETFFARIHRMNVTTPVVQSDAGTVSE